MPDRSPVLPLQPARVVLHTSFLVVPLAYALGGVTRSPMLAAAVALAVVFLSVDAARLAWPGWNRRALTLFAPFLREEERRRLTGASYTLLALVVAVWAFPPPVVGAAFVYHSIGDTAAGWVGRRWGRHRWGTKSMEGSAAFVGAGSLAAWPLVGVLPAILGAGAAAAAELALPVDDNLTVPLVGGAVALATVAARGA